MLHQPVAILFRNVDDFGDEQHLRGQPLGVQRLAHCFEDQPLMRGMLVDDDEPVLGLGDDIVGVDLRPRCAERIPCVWFGG